MARKQRTSKETKELFRDPSGQPDLFEKSYQEELEAKAKKQVECLGMTFENDEARRAYFLEKLKEKLKDPEFRKIEGFPIGSDEDILALSDPPYYTACPNPFIEDFIRCYGKLYDSKTDKYRREPFAADVSEGKNDPIYNAHSYHTKVPHKAIMRYILHYTEPGDIVFDGFSGTGMTGVAGQLCGNKAVIESLACKVQSDGGILDEKAKRFSKIGMRRTIQIDLSPAATFIAYNYNDPSDGNRFEREARRILREVEEECGWMYVTLHQPKDKDVKNAVNLIEHASGKRPFFEESLRLGQINYVVWSDVFLCPECAGDIVFWKEAVDTDTWQVRDIFNCPQCNAKVGKRKLERAFETKNDRAFNKTIRQAKQVPALIHYYFERKSYLKSPDQFDLALLKKIENLQIPYPVPTNRMPEGDEARRNDPLGITHVHQFYTARNLWVLSSFAAKQGVTRKYVNVSSVATIVTKMYRFRSQNGSLGAGGGPLTGTLYVPSLTKEIPMTKVLSEHVNKWIRIKKNVATRTEYLIATASNTCLFNLGNQTVDYIFTDPPFGANFMYSELNFIWETWLRVLTNNLPEAIQSQTQQKDLLAYQHLMTRSFQESYRVLKPGRWMTVEFHNSKNSVWNAIQEALQSAGFVIADVRTLDKRQGTFKQVTSRGAVKQDLIISAYKPNGGLEERFRLEAGTEEGVWDFIRSHLRQLPTFVSKDGQAEIVAERQNYLLFDRMVAFHIQRGVTVPLSAAEFYQGLAQRFPERDGMFFLPDQAAEYDKKRMTVRDMLQLELFVIDESSAIQWLRQQILKKPQTFQEIHPQFLKEISAWEKHEKTLELMELLEQNFLRYDGEGEVPSNIHSYLSSNFKELRNLAKDDPVLRAKAKDRWYVPDPNKAGDLEKLRERALLKEFDEYLPAPELRQAGRTSSQKRLKVFRLEAVRAGFKKAWQERDYKTIIEVARKIPENVLQEDPKLLMWYDQAVTRTGEE